MRLNIFQWTISIFPLSIIQSAVCWTHKLFHTKLNRNPIIKQLCKIISFHLIRIVSNRNSRCHLVFSCQFSKCNMRLKIQYLCFLFTSEINQLENVNISMQRMSKRRTLIGCGSHYSIQSTTQSMISLSLQTSCTYIDQQHHIVRRDESASQRALHIGWSRLKLKMNEFPISQ